MHYKHNPKNLAENVAKHQVWFEFADDFEWETAIVTVDNRHQYAEIRFRATGLIAQRVHVLVFCFRETKIRLISLRRANQREVKRYARDP